MLPPYIRTYCLRYIMKPAIFAPTTEADVPTVSSLPTQVPRYPGRPLSTLEVSCLLMFSHLCLSHSILWTLPQSSFLSNFHRVSSRFSFPHIYWTSSSPASTYFLGVSIIIGRASRLDKGPTKNSDCLLRRFAKPNIFRQLERFSLTHVTV